jgi:hypothetical protein
MLVVGPSRIGRTSSAYVARAECGREREAMSWQ